MRVHYDIAEAINGKDIVCTDSLPADMVGHFRKCQISLGIMRKANKAAVLNLCPPFYRGEEVTEDVMNSNSAYMRAVRKILLSMRHLPTWT